MRLNGTVKFLTLLLHIWKVPGSNSNQGHPFKQILGWYFKIGHDYLILHDSQLIIHKIILLFDAVYLYI